MRDYSKVSGSFWTGRTGKNIRRDMETQIVAMYLMTCSHANMIGVFFLPIGYITIDTGLTHEGASKGLARLSEEGFCTYDDDSEMVFVHEMAKFQIGESLKPTDNRVKDIRKQYDALSETRIKSAFFDKYLHAFSLISPEESSSPFEAPSKPGAETGAGTEKNKTMVRSSASRFEEFWMLWPKSPRKVAKASCEKKWRAKKLDGIADRIMEHLKAISKTKQWLDGFDPAPSTYLSQGRWGDEIFEGAAQGSSNTKPWFISNSGIEAKAVELGITKLPDEQFPYFKVRVYKEAGVTKEDVRKANQDFDARK
ncbi:MAG TPA: hypothetical protein VK974_04805 [Methylophilaceae bacterium]|nr:hypothetical protein [Methylophilaceae bacterium]